MAFHGWEQVERAHALVVLKRLQELFSKQERWIEWPLAEDKDGEEVKPSDPTATKFCLLGACELFAARNHSKPLSDFVECAVYEYLDDLSGGEIIKGKTGYAEEFAMIVMATKELSDD